METLQQLDLKVVDSDSSLRTTNPSEECPGIDHAIFEQYYKTSCYRPQVGHMILRALAHCVPLHLAKQ